MYRLEEAENGSTQSRASAITSSIVFHCSIPHQRIERLSQFEPLLSNNPVPLILHLPSSKHPLHTITHPRPRQSFLHRSIHPHRHSLDSSSRAIRAISRSARGNLLLLTEAIGTRTSSVAGQCKSTDQIPLNQDASEGEEESEEAESFVGALEAAVTAVVGRVNRAVVPVIVLSHEDEGC
jgi:hypothetical protein